MKKIAFVFIAALAVLSFAGCKKKGGVADAMAKMEGFKKDMCACADKDCADKVSKAMDDYTKSLGDKGEKMMKEMSEDDKKKSMALGEELGKCMMKHMAPAMPEPTKETPPATPPAADGSAAAAPPAGDEKKPDDKAATPPADEKK